MMTEFEHTQHDYPLSFKIAVVEQVGEGKMADNVRLTRQSVDQGVWGTP